MKKYFVGDFLIMTEVALIGMAEAAHLAATVLGWSLARCSMFLGILVCVAFAGGLCMIYLTGRYRGNPMSGEADRKLSGKRQRKAALRPVEFVLWGIFGLLLLTQLLFLCAGDGVYSEGDMTVETVGSFLAHDRAWLVNPMTGLPYTAGIPSRLKILCLPTLYASLCRLTGLEAVTVVWRVVPVITLVSSYTAFYGLAAALFPAEEEKHCREMRACFMTIVSLLLWVGCYQYGMDGFNLLCCGWRGVTIRNLVLLPWMLSLCIRRKWRTAVLCIPAEACIVWTLYGCGVCLLFLLGVAGIGLYCRRTGTQKRQRA